MSLKLEAFFSPSVILLANALELIDAPNKTTLQQDYVDQARYAAFKHTVDRVGLAQPHEIVGKKSLIQQARELIDIRRHERVIKIRERARRTEERRRERELMALQTA